MTTVYISNPRTIIDRNGRGEKEQNAFLWGIGHMMIAILSLSIVALLLNTLLEEMLSNRDTKPFFWILLYLPLAIIWGCVMPRFICNKGKTAWITFLSINLVVIAGVFSCISHSESGLQYFSKSTGKLMSSYIISLPGEKEGDRYDVVPFSYNKIEVQLSYIIPSESQNKEIVVDQTAIIFSTPLTFEAYKKLQEIRKIATLSINVGGKNKEEVRNRIREAFLMRMEIPEKEAEVSMLGI